MSLLPPKAKVLRKRAKRAREEENILDNPEARPHIVKFAQTYGLLMQEASFKGLTRLDIHEKIEGEEYVTKALAKLDYDAFRGTDGIYSIHWWMKKTE